MAAKPRLARPKYVDVYTERQRLLSPTGKAWNDLESLKIMTGPLVKAIIDNEMGSESVIRANLWHDLEFLGNLRDPESPEMVDSLFASPRLPLVYDWRISTTEGEEDEHNSYYGLLLVIYSWDGLEWENVQDIYRGNDAHVMEWLKTHEEDFRSLWAPLSEASEAEVSAQAAPRQFWLVDISGSRLAWSYTEVQRQDPAALPPECFHEGMLVHLNRVANPRNLRVTFNRPPYTVYGLEPHWPIEDITNLADPRVIRPGVRPAEASGTQDLPTLNAVSRGFEVLLSQEDDQPF